MTMLDRIAASTGPACKGLAAADPSGIGGPEQALAGMVDDGLMYGEDGADRNTASLFDRRVGLLDTGLSFLGSS